MWALGACFVMIQVECSSGLIANVKIFSRAFLVSYCRAVGGVS